ncbi:[protein-PII] uridylyltransferase [Sphingomonas sp. BIUV-7]|uniref:Bifunctional uridylyltransferase/uridylyl-removing enzyme n=1 Tax=Sphingomonas natans TaxID=3063330 RepID=A0ABT8YBP8_9SPHN|nr:[protein-PII] uridylyltransferase [Sphingomonas sp. BIUV-7]MDO6415757.1 [protein-PII] uridylyltransferase [Sphingomonas sp. BIUV-7]
MTNRFDHLPARRAIIDRRAIADALDALQAADTLALRLAATPVLRAALAAGRDEIARRLTESPSAGNEIAASYAFLTDQILRLVFDFTTQRLYPLSNPSAGERLTLAAVGGYGRGEMALHSDIDIAFLTPWKQAAWAEQVIESMLYTLWDLGLKVGHSSRSLDEMVRMANSDLTIRTALLEARYVWGDQPLYDEAARRFDTQVVAGTARAFVAEKLGERNARHERMGDSRYVVEPNLKEGKGGLRDLHALFWIGKYAYQVRDVGDLVERGLFTAQELKRFRKAENFLWAVRCHLHVLSRRAEDRLTFDVQSEIARRMRYADRPGKSAVERFMQHYFLIAKEVGDLTAIFLAHLDETFAAKGRRFGITLTGRKPRKLEGFVLDRGRLAAPSDGFFAEDPVRLLQMFALADLHALEIHPLTLRMAGRDAKMIDARVRADPEANRHFMHVLASKRDPERVLRTMNEAGIFGRFVPDFGRVVAQMQFDMYHHYTVDEHTLRAIGLLSRIERGLLEDQHPGAAKILEQVVCRRAVYVAVLLHDIAKGRGGDHSVLGADVARKLCPRFGMTPAETETVAWLVEQHLLMSAVAFKRDLSDFKTILDFAERVQSPERLRQLLLLTTVDIRAVGPGVWNDWKRQLLGTLFAGAEEVLRLGHQQRGRIERINLKQDELGAQLGWGRALFDVYRKRFPDSYWVAEGGDILARNARLIAAADAAEQPLSIETQPDASRGATLVTIYAADHPGLFYRIAGAIHLAGASIIDARIHTTRDGMAIDNLLVQDPFGKPFDDPMRLRRLETAIEDALANRSQLAAKLATKPSHRTRADAFVVAPNVLIDNKASNRYTVVEVNAHDRPALLHALAHALFQAKVTIRSAHVATYGTRAVDTFYLTDLIGDKIDGAARLRTLERLLLAAAGGKPIEEEAPRPKEKAKVSA